MTAAAPAPGHVPSWYAATAVPFPALAPLEGETACDAVVVGGGYTGLSAALELAERGYDAVLLEAERIGWGASGRNGGQIVTGFGASIAALPRTGGVEGAQRLWDMAEEAKRLLAERVARHAIACDLSWGYLIAAHDRAQMREVETERAVCERFGYGGLRVVDRREMADLVATPIYIGGAVDSGGGQLHPLNYALGLARAARAAGARLYEGSKALSLEGGRTASAPVVVRTAAGSVTARYAILAGNAYLNRLSPRTERAVRSRVMPVATFMLATERLGPERTRALIPCGHAVGDMNFVISYYRPSPDGRLLFGSGASYTAREPRNLEGMLRRKMVRVFPSLKDAAADYVWGGYVGITRNRLPHFGRIGPNVFYAQGFSGAGVAVTGLAGRLMAEAVAGTAERFDLFARLPHAPFPGGRWFRTPLLAAATGWFKLRDLL
jgi:gamma-glutamylputrescine oxidase